MICALGLSIVVREPAIAGPPELFGYGARGIAGAGSGVATATGHAATWYNPARLTLERRPSVALALQSAYLRLPVRVCRDGECSEIDQDPLNAPAISIGFGVPLPFGGALQDRLALGLAFVLPQTSILIADTPRPGEITFPVVENRAQTVSIMAALGARLHDRLSIGFGMIALAELRGAIDVSPNDAGTLGSSARDELFARYGYTFSAFSQLTPVFSLGLIGRTVSRADYTLPINADLGDEFPIPVPELRVEGVAQYDPAQLTLATAARFDSTHVAAELTWKRWSRFPNPIRYTAVPADYPAQPEPGFHDTLTARLFAERSFEMGRGTAWAIPRAGFAFEQSPTPEQTGLHNHLDSHRLVAGLGLGVRFHQFTVDVGAQSQSFLSRGHSKSCAPTNLSGDQPEDAEVGPIAPTWPDSNPGCGEVSHRGQIWTWALEMAVEL